MAGCCRGQWWAGAEGGEMLFRCHSCGCSAPGWGACPLAGIEQRGWEGKAFQQKGRSVASIVVLCSLHSSCSRLSALGTHPAPHSLSSGPSHLRSSLLRAAAPQVEKGMPWDTGRVSVNNLVPVADLECIKSRISDQNIFPEGSLKTDELDPMQRIHCEAISSTPPENRSYLSVFCK